MSRPRRSVQAKKYIEEDLDSDEGSSQEEVISNGDAKSEEELSAYGDSDDGDSDISESFPHSLPIVTHTDLRHAHTVIAQQRQAIETLKSLHDQQKTRQAAAEAELRAAQKVLLEIQAIIAPISRVPPEILGVIFTAHVQDNQESPWSLMHVSRAWRAAALMTKAMWGRILIAPSSWVKAQSDGQSVRVYNGMEVCNTEAKLSRALKRAGAMPLDLMVVFLYQSWRRMTHNSDYDYDASRLIDCILSQRPNTLLRGFKLCSTYMTSAPEKLMEFDYSNIDTLYLDMNFPNLVQKLVKERRGPRSFHIGAVNLDKIENCGWLDKIEDLGITNITYYTSKPKLLRSTIFAPTNLLSLKLSGGPIVDQNQDEQQLRIMSLRRLELNVVHQFWPIDCPNLTHLTLHFSRSPPTPPQTIHLPHLVEFSLWCERLPERCLSVFEVPSLQKFDFRWGEGKAVLANALKALWLVLDTNGAVTVSNVEPRKLLLRQTAINQKVLARVLAGRKLLEEIMTVDVEISADFFEALSSAIIGKGMKRSQATQLSCPALKRIEVDLAGDKKFRPNEEAMEASACALIAARKKAGAPLERVAIRMTKKDGWKELVRIEEV
ncbi:hypothetical protein M408DRAFT_10766 [Serendipita vermifera MAFF 305830]|uniref:F-box domain-containing protein n=1 Tax=Serendipita vermifera MAFF 305830 TaxID=933852 RepID=A0A0C3B026_SERVB|nr:hypothetical protein M408DRAFT_10766 [Serendipita vermifera MAFF 305830]